MLDKEIIKKISLYIDAQYPVIHLDTYEYIRIDRILNKVCKEYEVYEYNSSNGLMDFKKKACIKEDIKDLEVILDYFNKLNPSILNGKVLVIKDIKQYFSNHNIILKLENLVKLVLKGIDFKIFLSGVISEFPEEIKEYITTVKFRSMNIYEIQEVINNFILEYNIEFVDNHFIEELCVLLKGFTEYEIENVLSLAYVTYGELSYKVKDLILSEKINITEKSNIFTLINDKVSFDEIGGLHRLKIWIKNKSIIYDEICTKKPTEINIDIPKGVCIVGDAGSGKSSFVKATSKLFNIPLLKLDNMKLKQMRFNKGGVEYRIDKIISYLERFSPCVLWINEIELDDKYFIKYLLEIIREKQIFVFTMITSENKENQFKDFMLKKLVDDIFILEPLNEKERTEILNIHLKKSFKDINNIDINYISKITEGLNGVLIEKIVKYALENSIIEDKENINTEDIVEIVNYNKLKQKVACLI